MINAIIQLLNALELESRDLMQLFQLRDDKYLFGKKNVQNAEFNNDSLNCTSFLILNYSSTSLTICFITL